MKAIASKKYIDENDKTTAEFFYITKDLLSLEQMKDLDNYIQHLNTSRLQHSINVAYYTYLLCKKFNLDYTSATRGALLHDFYFYDWRIDKPEKGSHVSIHPKLALKTAQSLIELNDIEKDSILNHMWPMTHKMPKYKESMIVSLIDKYCTVLEVFTQFKNRCVQRFRLST